MDKDATQTSAMAMNVKLTCHDGRPVEFLTSDVLVFIGLSFVVPV